jgi:hypothetical protein
MKKREEKETCKVLEKQKMLNKCLSNWKKKKWKQGQEPVAHAYNPSYSGGKGQEDCSLKLTQANSTGDPTSKKTYHKKGLEE